MIGYVALLVLAALVLLVWVSRHLTLSGIVRRQDTLRPDDQYPLPDNPPKVSIVVPAKDEQDNIAECIATLLAQDYPNFEIIVVDDRSTDRTAEIAGELADQDGRIRLVRIDDLPPGWFGKSHAMCLGAAETSGEWLRFVDADCRQTVGSVRTAVGYTLSRGGDMLTIMRIGTNPTTSSIMSKTQLMICRDLLFTPILPDS